MDAGPFHISYIGYCRTSVKTKEHVFYPGRAIFYVYCVYWVFLRDVRDVFWASFSCSWKRQIKASFYVPCSFSSIISEPKGKYLMTPLISCLTSSPQVMHLKRSLTMDIKLVGISQYGHKPAVISGLNFRNFLLKNLLILRLTIFFVSSQVLSSIVAF